MINEIVNKNMTCTIENRSELIAEYLSGQMSEQDSRYFEEHYFQCETCFKELQIAEDAVKILEQDGPVSINKKKTVSTFSAKDWLLSLLNSKRWVIAAAVIGIIAMLFLMIFIPAEREVYTDRLTPQEKFENPVQEPLAKNDTESDNDIASLTGPSFEPSPYYEEWITENLRSGSGIIKSVISPVNEEIFHNKDVIFNWEMNEKEAVTLKILNNLEEEIYSAAPGSKYTISVPSAAFRNSGLYYWRIEDENEVLYIGKIFFLKN